MNFEFVYIYRHIYRKLVFLVDTKCRNTIILTGLTYTWSQKVFYDMCAKRGTFSHQILNKNSLSLAHCVLNRSFTVFCAFISFYCDVVEETSMFVWGVLKLGVPNSVRFCMGDLPMYIFFIPPHPYK